MILILFPFAAGLFWLAALIDTRDRKPTHPSLRNKTTIRPLPPAAIALGKKPYLGPRNKSSR